MIPLDSFARMVPQPHHIWDDLIDLSSDHYQHAIEFYVERMSQMPGVLFIGQFGSINTPGVSDIDLLVLVQDDRHSAAEALSQEVVQTLTNGPYMFWHPASIIPLSLWQPGRVLHTFSQLRALWGDRTLIDAAEQPHRPLETLSATIWNGFFWRVALKLRYDKHPLRLLLLVINNLGQGVAAYYRILNRPDESESILRWGKEIRSQITAASGPRRVALALDALAQAMHFLHAADWDLQAWWLDEAWERRPPYSDVIRPRSAGKHIVIEFTHTLDEPGWSPMRTARRVSWKLKRIPYRLTFPSCYPLTANLIRGAFDAHHGSPPFDALAVPWQNAVATYIESMEAFRRYMRDHDSQSKELDDLWRRVWNTLA